MQLKILKYLNLVILIAERLSDPTLKVILNMRTTQVLLPLEMQKIILTFISMKLVLKFIWR